MENRGINVSNMVKTKQRWIVEGSIQMKKAYVEAVFGGMNSTNYK